MLMRSLKSSGIFLISFLLVSTGFGSGKAPLTPPIKANEPIIFMSREENPIIAVNKTQDFMGIIEREHVKDPVNRQIDLYEFKKLKDLRVSQKLCDDIATNIFGDLKNLSFELKLNEIKKSKAVGKICFLVLQDKTPDTFIKEKHLYVMISNLRVMALVFRYAMIPTQPDLENDFKFINSLR